MTVKKQCRQTLAKDPKRREGLQNIKSQHRQIIRDPKMNRRVADSALLPYERQGSIVTYVTAVASAEKGARCALIFILGGSVH